MPRLNVLSPDQATGPTKQIFDDVTAKMGKVVSIFQGMTNSPAGLKAYLSMSAASADGELSPENREVVYLAVSENNGCHDCVSAHSMLAKQAGLSDDETLAARTFQSPGEKRAALLDFVRKVIAAKGFSISRRRKRSKVSKCRCGHIRASRLDAEAAEAENSPDRIALPAAVDAWYSASQNRAAVLDIISPHCMAAHVASGHAEPIRTRREILFQAVGLNY